MTLTLYHTPGSRSVRPLWLLEEMGVPYTLVTKEYDRAYFASDEFRAINPMGKVPALYEGDQLIIESTAIMDYILNIHGPGELGVGADNPEYSAYLQWFHMAESGMANYIAVSFGHKSGQDLYRVSDEFDAYCRFQITKALEVLESRLADRDYLVKSGFSAADISLGYTLFFAEFAIQPGFTNNVKAYYDRLMSRPALQKALGDLAHKG